MLTRGDSLPGYRDFIGRLTDGRPDLVPTPNPRPCPECGGRVAEAWSNDNHNYSVSCTSTVDGRPCSYSTDGYPIKQYDKAWREHYSNYAIARQLVKGGAKLRLRGMSPCPDCSTQVQIRTFLRKHLTIDCTNPTCTYRTIPRRSRRAALRTHEFNVKVSARERLLEEYPPQDGYEDTV